MSSMSRSRSTRRWCQRGVIWNRLTPVEASAKGSTIVTRDFTTGSLGVRLYDDFCTVIIRKSGVDGWLEDGQRFPLPLPDRFDSIVTIPASTLALAVSTFEAKNLGSGLREMLTQKPATSR